MNVKYEFDRDYFKRKMIESGYVSIADFCKQNDINYNSLSNVIYKNNLSITMLCRLALTLECRIDDLLIYGEE